MPLRGQEKTKALQQNLWVTQGYPIALKAAKTKRENPFGLSTTDVMGDTTGESVTVGFPEAQLPLHIASSTRDVCLSR